MYQNYCPGETTRLKTLMLQDINWLLSCAEPFNLMYQKTVVQSMLSDYLFDSKKKKKIDS